MATTAALACRGTGAAFTSCQHELLSHAAVLQTHGTQRMSSERVVDEQASQADIAATCIINLMLRQELPLRAAGKSCRISLHKHPVDLAHSDGHAVVHSQAFLQAMLQQRRPGVTLYKRCAAV